MMLMNGYITDKGISGRDIKSLRLRLKMSQTAFADLLNVSKKTIERWESSDTVIDGPVAVVAFLMRMYPDVLDKIRLPEQEYPLRLIYKDGDMICAVIDVDEVKRLVKVTNYRYDCMDLPFGNNSEPDYEEYEAFLESRCFPRTRHRVDIELAKLGIPFYDPLQIIEKTEGRMAEDGFNIEVVRL